MVLIFDLLSTFIHFKIRKIFIIPEFFNIYLISQITLNSIDFYSIF